MVINHLLTGMILQVVSHPLAFTFTVPSPSGWKASPNRKVTAEKGTRYDGSSTRRSNISWDETTNTITCSMYLNHLRWKSIWCLNKTGKLVYFPIHPKNPANTSWLRCYDRRWGSIRIFWHNLFVCLIRCPVRFVRINGLVITYL